MTATATVADDWLNPLAGTALDEVLPGLRTAMKAEEVGDELAQALGVKAHLRGCTVAGAIYLGATAVVRYELDLDGTTAVVTGRVFPTKNECSAWVKQSMAVLERAGRRDELVPFAHPVARVDRLHMVLSAFPVDAGLPNLIDATDKPVMLSVLRERVPAALGEPLDIGDYRMHLAHYGRQHRCVLRFDLEATTTGGAPRPLSVYAKVSHNAEGALAAPVVERLRAGASFRVPRSIGYLADRRIALFEGIAGMPRVAALMRARLTGMPTQDPTLPSLEDAVRMCGHIAAELHESGIELGAPRPFDGEAVMLGSFAELMRPVSPGLAERFDEWLGAVKAEAASQPAQPRVFTHGDFSYTQLILDGRSMGLVDFDTVCQAEPAMDIGHFFAYLQLAGRKAGGAARDEVTARLRTEFLSAYIDHRGLAGADAQPLIGRVKTYEMLSLLRLAAHGWQKLKPSRLRYIVAAIDDHVGRPGHF